MTGTPAAERCEREVMARYDEFIVGIGQYNRRPIADTSTWSQHSWANALDLHVSLGRPANATERARGDQIAAWLRANRTALGIRTVLWWVEGHFDHIHVDFWPKGIDTPPISSTGVGRFKYSSGAEVSATIQTVPAQGAGLGDEMMEVLINIFKGQNSAFYAALKAKTGEPHGDHTYWASDDPRQPSQAEWEAAAPKFLAAALQTGVFAEAGTVDQTARTMASTAQSIAVAQRTRLNNLDTSLANIVV